MSAVIMFIIVRPELFTGLSGVAFSPPGHKHILGVECEDRHGQDTPPGALQSNGVTDTSPGDPHTQGAKGCDGDTQTVAETRGGIRADFLEEVTYALRSERY